jgi:GDP-L-fucose synthase
VADVLVTGAAGFLGRHVCAALRARGVDFVPLVNRAVDDLRDPQATYEAFFLHKPKTLIHLACPTPGGLGEMAKHPMLVASMGRMDASVVENAVFLGVKRLITVGSLCSYDPFDSINGPYGVAKRYLHALLEAAWRERGVAYTFLELTNLYGPGDRSQHVIPATIRKIQHSQMHGGDVRVWGTGLDRRGFCYVEDAAQGIVDALDDTGVHSDRLGPWDTVRIDTLVYWLRAHLAAEGVPVLYDIDKPALERPDIAPTRYSSRSTPFEIALRETVRWWLQHPEETQP